MTKIEHQISEPRFNPNDGKWYNRSRDVYDLDGDGVLEVSNERINSAIEKGQLPNPSTKNQARQAIKDLIEALGARLVPLSQGPQSIDQPSFGHRFRARTRLGCESRRIPKAVFRCLGVLRTGRCCFRGFSLPVICQ